MINTATAAGRRPRPGYRCAACGWAGVKWVGRCPECAAWGTVEEAAAPQLAPTGALATGQVTSPALPIPQVQAQPAVVRATGIGEFDRVLGGGVVPGAVALLAGEPGVGKSTLLLEVAARVARSGGRVLYVTGEESAAQVRLRAERTSALHQSLFLAAETALPAVLAHVEQVDPELLVVDSVQTIGAADVDGLPGGVAHVRAVTAALVATAKKRHLPVVLVGHVTKDGGVAGPRTLEHVVDVVLQFEGERQSRFRLLRAGKNRFGPVDEIGCFDLTNAGIVEITDPTGLFTSHRGHPVPGTCLTVALEGLRPLLTEVQSLVASTGAGLPRRAVSGLDSARLLMLLAVLERRAGIQLSAHDVYASTVGGAVLREPAADLAVVFSLVTAAANVPLPESTIAIGEVGLAGELRPVPQLDRRLGEAARLGFSHAVIPDRSGQPMQPAVDGLDVLACADLEDALRAVGAARAGPRLATIQREGGVQDGGRQADDRRPDACDPGRRGARDRVARGP